MAGVDEQNEGIGALVGRVVEDGRHLVTAEVALFKAKATERVGAYRSAAAFFAIAGVLALAVLIALLVGLILTLSPLVGPGFATLIVVGVTMVVIVVLALIGKSRLSPPALPGETG